MPLNNGFKDIVLATPDTPISLANLGHQYLKHSSVASDQLSPIKIMDILNKILVK